MLKIGQTGWIEKEVPACGPLDAICRPLALAPCTSDMHTVWAGAIGDRHNMILGHEAVGEVVEVGSLVRDFKAGDKVLVSAITPDWGSLAAQEGYHPLYGAAALVVLSAPGGLDEKGFNMANVSCAAENMLLAAAGLGLGSCFLMGPMAAFSDPALRARLELPEGYEPLVGVALGYAAPEHPAAPERTDAGITWCR